MLLFRRLNHIFFLFHLYRTRFDIWFYILISLFFHPLILILRIDFFIEEPEGKEDDSYQQKERDNRYQVDLRLRTFFFYLFWNWSHKLWFYRFNWLNRAFRFNRLNWFNWLHRFSRYHRLHWLNWLYWVFWLCIRLFNITRHFLKCLSSLSIDYLRVLYKR